MQAVLSIARRSLMALVFAAVPDASEAQQSAGAEADPKRRAAALRQLKQADSWAYQLQNLRPTAIPKDAFDVLVVDYSRDGGNAGALKPADVAALRKRPNRPDRLVLSYMSIGEAEDYRAYWDSRWLDHEAAAAAVAEAERRTPPTGDTPRPILGTETPAAPLPEKSARVPDPAAPLAKLSASAPSWLAEENPEWRGNYLVRYWEPGWQALMFGEARAYLDRIIAAGFDGVYLDKIDSNDDWQKRGRPQAEREMIEFVKRLAAYARSKRPGFLIVPQNGDELLVHRDYLAAIDAIAKEDLLFGGDQRKDGEPNPEREIAASARRLTMARKAGKPVLAVDYIKDRMQIRIATRRYREWGFVPFYAERELSGVPEDIVARVDAMEAQVAEPPRQQSAAKGRKR